MTPATYGGIREAGDRLQLERLLYALWVVGSVIIADDRLSALGEPLHRQHRKLHDAGEDRHGTDGQITAVVQEEKS